VEFHYPNENEFDNDLYREVPHAFNIFRENIVNNFGNFENIDMME